MISEANFLPHCDSEDCDLGCFAYRCPCCNVGKQDYDIWWEQDNILNGEIHKPLYFKVEGLTEDFESYSYLIKDKSLSNIKRV